MAYHPILDWRTGLDMFVWPSIRAPPLTSSIRTGRVARSRRRAYFSSNHMTPGHLGGLDAGIDEANHVAVVITHPLWDTNPSTSGRTWRPLSLKVRISIYECGCSPCSV